MDGLLHTSMPCCECKRVADGRAEQLCSDRHLQRGTFLGKSGMPRMDARMALTLSSLAAV